MSIHDITDCIDDVLNTNPTRKKKHELTSISQMLGPGAFPKTNSLILSNKMSYIAHLCLHINVDMKHFHKSPIASKVVQVVAMMKKHFDVEDSSEINELINEEILNNIIKMLHDIRNNLQEENNTTTNSTVRQTHQTTEYQQDPEEIISEILEHKITGEPAALDNVDMSSGELFDRLYLVVKEKIQNDTPNDISLLTFFNKLEIPFICVSRILGDVGKLTYKVKRFTNGCRVIHPLTNSTETTIYMISWMLFLIYKYNIIYSSPFGINKSNKKKLNDIVDFLLILINNFNNIVGELKPDDVINQIHSQRIRFVPKIDDSRNTEESPNVIHAESEQHISSPPISSPFKDTHILHGVPIEGMDESSVREVITRLDSIEVMLKDIILPPSLSEEVYVMKTCEQDVINLVQSFLDLPPQQRKIQYKNLCSMLDVIIQKIVTFTQHMDEYREFDFKVALKFIDQKYNRI